MDGLTSENKGFRGALPEGAALSGEMPFSTDIFSYTT